MSYAKAIIAKNKARSRVKINKYALYLLAEVFVIMSIFVLAFMWFVIL